MNKTTLYKEAIEKNASMIKALDRVAKISPVKRIGAGALAGGAINAYRYKPSYDKDGVQNDTGRGTAIVSGAVAGSIMGSTLGSLKKK